jgi:hypothetical protein
MKTKFICFTCSIFLLISASAQYLSLNKIETKKLISLVNTDKDVKQLYLKMERLANTALTEVPNPIDTIVSEGHLATDPKKIRTVKSLADLHKIYALAISYTITNKDTYKTKCIEYLKRMHLNFGCFDFLVTENDEYVFLECTSQDNPFGYQANFTDDRNVVVIKPEGGEIVRTKNYEAKDNTQISKGNYSIG